MGVQNSRKSKNLLQTCSCSSSSVRMFLNNIIIIITTPPLSSLLLDLLLLLLLQQHRWWAICGCIMRRQILCKFCTWFLLPKSLVAAAGSGCTPTLVLLSFLVWKCCCYFAQQTDWLTPPHLSPLTSPHLTSPHLTSHLTSHLFSKSSLTDFLATKYTGKHHFAHEPRPTKTGTNTACKCR